MTLSASIALLFLIASPDPYEEQLRAARAAMAKRSFDEAAGACRQALRLVRGKEPLREASALEVCGDVEMRRERPMEAAKRYAQAARLAREDLKLRRKLLNRRKKAAEKAKAEKSAELANEILEADRTLEQVRRRPRRSGDGLEKALSSLAEAAQTYRRDRDPDRAEEALALRALVLVRSEKPDDGLRAAERVVSKRPAKHAAILAHEARAWALLERGEVESAAKAAIEYSRLRSPGHRTPIMDRACRKYDGEHGDGQCTRLEIKLTGDATFTDFSAGKRKPELTDDDIERVHAQALPALEDCVLAAARKEPELYRNVEIQLSWSIDPEGRPIELDVAPTRNEPDIMPCAKSRLERIRYPKVYSRERKNVVIPYRLD
jgi:hypothetical protein